LFVRPARELRDWTSQEIRPVSTSVASRILYPPAIPLSANQIAQQQLDRIADRLGLDQATRDLQRSPRRELKFLIPARMNDAHGMGVT